MHCGSRQSSGKSNGRELPPREILKPRRNLKRITDRLLII